MGIRDARDHLGRRVDLAFYLGEPTVITASGEPRAVLVPYWWWKAIQDHKEET